MINKIHKTMTPILTYYFAILFGYFAYVGVVEVVERLFFLNCITLSMWFGGKAAENVIGRYKQ